MVDRLDTTHAQVPEQTVHPQGITCGTQRHSVLYKTVGSVVGQEGRMESMWNISDDYLRVGLRGCAAMSWYIV